MLLFVAIQLIIQITLNYCVDGSMSHFKFPKVVQAHTLSEVGNLGTISLRVCSRTILPIFIEIGSYLTEKEQKISWHSFFETRCRIKTILSNHQSTNQIRLNKVHRDACYEYARSKIHDLSLKARFTRKPS